MSCKLFEIRRLIFHVGDPIFVMIILLFGSLRFIIPSEARLYPRSTDIFRRHRRRRRRRRRQRELSWPKNFDISRMVYGITIRLAGMKALVAVKQQ